MSAVLTLLLGIIVILAIIAANGYFVAQEFAYMSVDRSRLGARAESGDAAAERALSVTRRTSFMLSGAQLGITVTGLLVGYVAEPLIGESLGELLGGVGVPTAVSISVGTILALALATIVQMIFGELYPKNLAIANPEPLALWLSRSTTIYLALFGWLITIFDHASNALLRLFGIEPVHDVDSSATAEDLERIIADSRDSGDLPEELSVLIDRILDFPNHDVEHAMIPRSQVASLTPETTIGELRGLMAGAHSRYPVLTDHEPVGVVQLIDLLHNDAARDSGNAAGGDAGRDTGGDAGGDAGGHAGGDAGGDQPTALADDAPISSLMRPPLVLPTLMSLPDALEELADSGNRLACIIDEYGGFAGILTIEDLAEELVGELTDEHDEHPPAMIEPHQDSTWGMSGEVHVDEAKRAIGHTLPAGDYETLSGLLIAHHGDLPQPGERVQIPLPEEPRDLVRDDPIHRMLDVEVLTLSRHVPDDLLVRLVETTAGEAGDSDGGAAADGGAADGGSADNGPAGNGAGEAGDDR